MKRIEAIIRPSKLDETKDALDKLGVQGMTVPEAKGFGRQKEHLELYRGAQREVASVPNVKVEIAVPDNMTDEVVSTIQTSAHTGRIGDGKIFTLPLEEAVVIPRRRTRRSCDRGIRNAWRRAGGRATETTPLLPPTVFLLPPATALLVTYIKAALRNYALLAVITAACVGERPVVRNFQLSGQGGNRVETACTLPVLPRALWPHLRRARFWR